MFEFSIICVLMRLGDDDGDDDDDDDNGVDVDNLGCCVDAEQVGVVLFQI